MEKQYHPVWKILLKIFGSIEKFKEEFTAAGIGQFGSGWCWLVQEGDGSLKVTKTLKME